MKSRYDKALDALLTSDTLEAHIKKNHNSIPAYFAVLQPDGAFSILRADWLSKDLRRNTVRDALAIYLPQHANAIVLVRSDIRYRYMQELKERERVGRCLDCGFATPFCFCNAGR